ncbi:MAG: hypothetical protein AB7F78_08495 [Hyphomicrobiaceae bacterium]
MDRLEHMRGLLRFVSPSDKARVRRWIENPRGGERLLEWLAHETVIPGKLALIRSAHFDHHHLIVHRPD